MVLMMVFADVTPHQPSYVGHINYDRDESDYADSSRARSDYFFAKKIFKKSYTLVIILISLC